MNKLLIVAELKDLEKQVALGEISYSRMVEIINEKHQAALEAQRKTFKTSKYRFGEVEPGGHIEIKAENYNNISCQARRYGLRHNVRLMCVKGKDSIIVKRIA